MSLYSIGFVSQTNSINTALFELVTASTLAIRIMEIGISQTVGTSGTYGLGRPNAAGVGGSANNWAFQAEQITADPAAKTTLYVSWGTSSPTAPANANYLRRITTPATVGAGVIWTFPRGLYVPVSSSLIVFNITATQVSNVWIVIDE